MLEQDGSQQVPFPHGHSNVTGLLMYRVPWTTPQLVLAKSPPVNQDIFLFAQTCVKTALGGKKDVGTWTKKVPIILISVSVFPTRLWTLRAKNMTSSLFPQLCTENNSRSPVSHWCYQFWCMFHTWLSNWILTRLPCKINRMQDYHSLPQKMNSNKKISQVKKLVQSHWTTE